MAKKRAEVTLTHPDKVLYPHDGFTKQDVADYYAAVAKPMVRALTGRPIAVERWPNGLSHPSWFQQKIATGVPDWLTYVDTPTSTKHASARHAVIDRPEALRWLAQNAALTVHTWASRADDLASPDWVVFDLDPADGHGVEQTISVAIALRKLLEKREIHSVVKTSGKRGLHVIVPIHRGASHEQAIAFAVGIGETLVPTLPQITMERAKANRRGRLYFDCFQNGYGKTLVAPYSPRGIDGAPVSAPLRWSEVTPRLDPKKFTIATMPRRLEKVGDLFGDAMAHRTRIH